eukprot:Gb_39407 [translate_table: standard]
MGDVSQPYGLVLQKNPAIREFLVGAASSADTESSEIRSSAGKYALEDAVPYTVIRDIWVQMAPSERPQFCSLLAGITFVLASPKPREKYYQMILKSWAFAFTDELDTCKYLQSKELKDRLQRLHEVADKKAYDMLVRDVTLKNEDKEYFSSYKDQLGFGNALPFELFST